jgi:hypothetical protein
MRKRDIKVIEKDVGIEQEDKGNLQEQFQLPETPLRGQLPFFGQPPLGGQLPLGGEAVQVPEKLSRFLNVVIKIVEK